MKTQKFKRTVSLLLAMLMCVTTLFGMGTTAFAAEETDEVYLISYPRDGDANYGGEWGTRKPELYERLVYGNIPFYDDPCNGVV